MRRIYSSLAVALLLAPGLAAAQAMDETVQKVKDGGIKVPGWMALLDPGAKEAITDAKLDMAGGKLHVMTGPAITYYNPANKASGDYTVKATFNEPQYMNLNDHPHPYGIVIAGNDLGTPTQSLLYCTAYGNGTFIMRGFGPAPFAVGKRGPNDAIHKAAGKGSPVTQEIAISVKGDQVSCIINGAVVGTATKAEVVGPGKLKSLDGVYGIRFAHNTEGTVADLKVTKP